MFHWLQKQHRSNRPKFEDEKEAPLLILKFFDHQLAKLLLIFVRDQCQLFENTIKSVEGDRISAYEAGKSIQSLLSQIEVRRDENFSSTDFQRELDEVELMLPYEDTIVVKRGRSFINEIVMVDKLYLGDMFHRFHGNNLFCIYFSLRFYSVLCSFENIYLFFSN